MISPQHSQRKGQEGEQYLTVPPLVYGITPQESLAGMDREFEKGDSLFFDQTILRAGDKQDQFPTQTDEVTTPSNTVYSKYNEDFSCHGNIMYGLPSPHKSESSSAYSKKGDTRTYVIANYLEDFISA